jgi:hypothetical protein
MYCSWLLYCSRSASLVHITVHEKLTVLSSTHRVRQQGTQKHAGQIHLREAPIGYRMFSNFVSEGNGLVSLRAPWVRLSPVSGFTFLLD